MTQPDPAAKPQPEALFSVDLSENAPPETGGQKTKRVLLGLVLMLLGGVLALACVAAFLASFLVPALWDWADLIGGGLLFIGALFLGLAILGFEIMRRSRKAPSATAYLEALAQVPGLDDGDSNPGPVLPPGASPTAPTSKPLV